MKRNTITQIQKLKNKQIITCLTAYSSDIAKIVDQHVDLILIGDSLGTVVYGMKNTQSVTLDMMKNHGRTVTRSSKKAFTVIDMPYNTYQNRRQALKNSINLINYTKCQSVKLETDKSKIDIVSYLVNNKIKVISHIGVIPQKFRNFNKIKYIGKTIKEKREMLDLACHLEDAGSSLIVLECIASELAKEITTKLSIPTIGIGSSVHCDGQILVINDILNSNEELNKPRFVKPYTNISALINSAVKRYVMDVKTKKFPTKKHSY